MANGPLIAPVHRFSAIHKRLREEWFEQVETKDKWVDNGPVGEGESESRRVMNTVTKLLGVAKPGPNKAAEENHCRAAHEKLAFDLSCLVGLTVCPVILWGEDIAQYKRGRSISAWAFPQSKKWDEAETLTLISPQHRTSAGPMVSAMRVFHTWIGDSDRKDAHIHVDLNSPSDELVIAFYDHANTLSNSWTAPAAQVTLLGDYMNQRGVPVVDEVMVETANLIAALDDAEITRLVQRIPTAYLPDPQRGNIMSNLLSRKGQLRALLPSP